MTKLEEVKNKIVEVIPEIMRLEFGCHVEIDTPKRYAEFATEEKTKGIIQFFVPTQQNGEDFERAHIEIFLPEWNESFEPTYPNFDDKEDDEYIKIIGREITLADVLRAIQLQKLDFAFMVDQEGGFVQSIPGMPPKLISVLKAQWNFSVGLSNQFPETINFLHSILITKS